VSTLPLQGPPGGVPPELFGTAGAAELFLLGRLLFGGVLAFMGPNHFLDAESLVAYAEAKGVPAAAVAVPFSGGQLLCGGLAVALRTFPALGAGALSVFLLAVTPVMHDFWNHSGEERQSELVNALKNAALLGASLVLLALSGAPWPYALGIGVV